MIISFVLFFFKKFFYFYSLLKPALFSKCLLSSWPFFLPFFLSFFLSSFLSFLAWFFLYFLSIWSFLSLVLIISFVLFSTFLLSVVVQNRPHSQYVPLFLSFSPCCLFSVLSYFFVYPIISSLPFFFVFVFCFF